jgi:putative transposase
LRVIKLFGLKPYRKRGRKWRKVKKNCRIYPNLLQTIDFPNRPNIARVSDFISLPFHGRIIYLATVMDIFDRVVKGWSLLNSHAVQLPLTALITAVERHGRPKVLHSEQGSEYKSEIYVNFAEGLGIKLSMINKSAPWENGYQESFYSQFKVDLGDWNRYKSVGELAVTVYLQIHYYNTLRNNSKSKMPPAVYAGQHVLTDIYTAVKL